MASNLPEFGGDELFAMEPARLFALLTDLDSVAELIPDRVSSARTPDGALECVVRPGFSFLRGTLKLRITVDDLQPPTSATMHVRGSGIGVDVKIESRLLLAAEETGVRMTWIAKVVSLKGLIATVSPGLIRAAAEQVIRQGWERVKSKA